MKNSKLGRCLINDIKKTILSLSGLVRLNRTHHLRSHLKGMYVITQKPSALSPSIDASVLKLSNNTFSHIIKCVVLLTQSVVLSNAGFDYCDSSYDETRSRGSKVRHASQERNNYASRVLVLNL